MHLNTLLSNPGEQCVTFLPEDVTHYLGYRFLESEPKLLNTCLTHPTYSSTHWGDIPPGITDQPTLLHSNQWKANWLAVYDTKDPNTAINLSFRALADGSAWCKTIEENQQREYFFQPVQDGVRIWLRFTTTQTIIGSCCIQQCLRFTGRMNEEWRQAVAYIPFLSELDMQAMGNPNGTLTYARRNHQWFNFPVPHTIYPVQAVSLTGPALSSEPIDNGLVARETPDRKQAPTSYFQKVAPGAKWDQITAGMYWERTAFVSNRHPADCIHTWVDIGPLEAGQSRTLHGKVYFIEGSKATLLEHWQRDFEGAG